MAKIVINEVSANYTYNIGSSSYACVALPITSSWGPGYYDPEAEGITADEMLERTTWLRFPANQAGLESFVSTYRGPATNYRLIKDYSYQVAMTLLTAGYDVLVCRVCPGTKAQGTFTSTGGGTVAVKAKYPGTFGNSLIVVLKKITYGAANAYWNLITYVQDSSGATTSVENKAFVFDIEHSTDTILHWSEIESDFVTLVVSGVTDADTFTQENVHLVGGSDKAADVITDPVVADDTAVPSATVKIVSGYRAYDSATDDGKVRYKYANSAYTEDAEGTYVADRFVLATADQLAAAAYDAAATYNVGALCINNSALYSCSTAITEAEAWNADHWTLVPTFEHTGNTNTAYVAGATAGGTFYVIASEAEQLAASSYETIMNLAKARYNGAGYDDAAWAASKYCQALQTLNGSDDSVKLAAIKYKEWAYTACTGTSVKRDTGVYSLLKDKLTYNPNRVISPGWDDQDVNAITESSNFETSLLISPLHITLLDTAYYSRCATGYIDIPASLARSAVWNENPDSLGYAQQLARYAPITGYSDVNSALYASHCALFAPWGQFTYVGTSRMATASPSFQALMIQRAQILNQALQYEWALPTNRKHNLNLGKLAYNVPKRYLDEWQSLEGVGVNVITDVPDLGTNVWGNSTLYEVPPAVYQALANLSTRLLVNAVEDVAYRCGISITFQYNNDQAYNKFYAGVTPILDTMKSVGAIDDYYVKMAADINGLDQVNANTVIGKIYLVVNGVVNDIYIDLIALPPSVSLDSVRS